MNGMEERCLSPALITEACEYTEDIFSADKFSGVYRGLVEHMAALTMCVFSLLIILFVEKNHQLFDPYY